MGTYSKISSTAFDEFQLDAGMILNKFDVTGKTAIQDADIVCATTGGITASAKPTFSDYGSDVDNCPSNVLELKRIDEWEAKISFTALSVTEEAIKTALSSADITDVSDGDSTIGKKLSPKNALDTSDFSDIWWVGDKSDGGFVAVRLMNALSNTGFSLKTTKKGKGQLSVEMLGHYSMASQDVVPIEFYVIEG